MSKIFWFLGLCLSTVGVTGALQAGQNPSKQASSKQAEDSESSSSEEDVPDEPVGPSEGAASASAADDSAAAAPARLNVRDRARQMEQAHASPESKPIRSAGRLSPDQVEGVGAGIRRGPLAGSALIAKRNALRAELQAKQGAFQAEDAAKQAEMGSIRGGLGFASAWDKMWGGKQAKYQQWRDGELRHIQALGAQLQAIEAEMETLGVRG